MTGEFEVLHAAERGRLAAVISHWGTADYLTVRALTALSDDANDRIARFTAMGRPFVADVRRRVRESGAAALLAEAPSVAECILETATHQLARPGRRGLTMRTVSDETGIPRRTLYNLCSSNGSLIQMCQRRGQTIWRARFEQRVLATAASAAEQVLGIVDVLDEWVASERFRRDQALCAPPSFAAELRDDDLREHLAEIDRFATALAA